MSDLVSWLLEQIAADERLLGPMPELVVTPQDDGLVRFDFVQPDPPPSKAHLECEAKRAIIDEHSFDDALVFDEDDPLYCKTCACPDCDPLAARWPCPTLRWLALPYSDRPGYQEDWKP